MNRPIDPEHITQLMELIASVNDPKVCRALFDDLCTVNELENMAERCFAAKLLINGDTYVQVMEQANISTATLSRVSRCIQNGTGYNQVIKCEKEPRPIRHLAPKYKTGL